MIIRTWTGKSSRLIECKVVRETDSGVIAECPRGVIYFAKWNDVLKNDDLFGDPL